MSFLSDDGHRAFALPGARLHYGPDKSVEVEHIDLHLEPDLERQRLDGICTTTVRALDEPVDRLVLDALEFEVLAAERDGMPLPFEHRDGRLELRFEPAIRPGEKIAFRVTYRVQTPRYGLFFVEPTPEYPNKLRHAWTQSQDENARYWFPCLDYPHAKQTTSATIVVPKGLFALSNGRLERRKESADRTTFTYEQNVPHSTYLMTMVVGPFVEVEQRSAGANGVPVWYYVLPGREADGERSFGNTPRMIELLEERIGTPYPYARYSQIAVGDFIFGGMENTTATTQTARTLHDARAHLDFSSDPLVAHELAHQWFGDLLTCRDWSHAWLNEGFATFFETIWREADLGYDEYLYDVFVCLETYLDEQQKRYSRPIVYNRYRAPIELFDRHLYQKGAVVLHMLRGELGESRFWRSIGHYVRANARRNVETIDFIRAIEESTGRNMRGFFDQWVFRAGHPVLEVNVAWDAQRKVATLTIDQKQKIDEDHPVFVFETDVGFVNAAEPHARTDFGPGPLEGERRIHIRIERPHETIAIPFDTEPSLVRFDPGSFVLADVTYTFSPAFAAAVLQGDPDPISRIRAARALAKDGSKSAQEAIADAFEAERFWGVLEAAATALGSTKAPWASEILVRALHHAHPKVRRAVAAALGNFRDSSVADALLPLAREDESYFVRAAALMSLGRTRDSRAFDVLVAALDEHSWNSVVESGAARGLAELADIRALDRVLNASMLGREEGLRRNVAAALGRIGELVEEARTRVVDRLIELVDDPMFLVRLAAVAAAESLEDPRLLPALERIAISAVDGRLRRDAADAAMRVREAQKVPTQVSALRSDLDTLREDYRKLQDQIETLSRS
jgi:aminopeptidase N